jgi:hypothetical protein
MTNLVAIYRTSVITKTGNYSGYDATGALTNRVHIPKSVAESFGLDKAGVAYPLFAVVSQETFGITDDNQKPVLDEHGEQKTFTQNRAGSLFAKHEDAVQAMNANKRINALAKDDLQRLGKELQLTDAVLAELVNAPF